MIPQFPFHRQLGELDCGITCLKMIIDFYGKPISFDYLNKIMPIHEDGVSLKDISDTAHQLGLNTLGVKVNYDRLVEEIPTPCIAFWRKQHFVVIYHADDEYVWIADPANRGIFVQSKESFQNGWICDKKNDSGILLLFETTPHFYESENATSLLLSNK
jgi:ATP-binding cassette subfamily B protein